MTGKKVFLIIQAILCVLLVVLLSVGAVRIFQEGTARKAEQPLEAIYTPQAVAAAFSRLTPLVYLSVGMTTAGLLLGIKDGPKAGKALSITAEYKVKKEESPRKRGAAQAALLAAAVVFIILGALNGSLMDVLAKAINLCSECIGLG